MLFKLFMNMENKTKHPREVIGYNGSLDQLAQAVGSMTYDQVALFLRLLSQDIKRQADADSGRGRKKLSKALCDAAQNLGQAQENMDLAWKVCEPYMPKKD